MNRDRYTDAQRAEAVELYRTAGPTAVQTQLGIHKGTVTKWAQAAGVATVSNQRNAAAVEAVKITTALRRNVVAERLWEIADVASRRELDLIGDANLHDVVGARTRAIHDAQLLDGSATGRVDLNQRREAVTADAGDAALRLVS